LKPHVFHPEAAAEYEAAGVYYAAIRPALGMQFFEEIEGILLDVRSDPARIPSFQGAVRRHFSNVFPFAVLYFEEADHIWIVAVMHMRREPGYWKKRLT
jgi:hypothetical protein